MCTKFEECCFSFLFFFTCDDTNGKLKMRIKFKNFSKVKSSEIFGPRKTNNKFCISRETIGLRKKQNFNLTLYGA